MIDKKIILIIAALILLLILVYIFINSYPNLDLKQFDSPDEPGSEKKMDKRFLRILNSVSGNFYRQTGKKLIFNSGYRSKQHNLKEGGVSNSSHLLGLAADISTLNFTLEEKKLLSLLLYKKGVRRFGIGSTFIHADIGDKKDSDLYVTNKVWDYGNTIPFNPLTLTT